MIAICVDDERIPLEMLRRAVEGSRGISRVTAFEDEDDALDWVRSHHVDVAFLDIELHRMNGLDLARECLAVHPQMAIVFCTSHEHYAVRTMKMHIDAGYLVKPFRPEQVQEEIDHILSKRTYLRRLKIRCFGDFEVFIDDQPVSFRRKKTKELLAYLVDRRGASVSTPQIVARLWEDDGNMERKKDLLYHLVSDLKQNLKQDGLEDILISDAGGYAIDPAGVNCDYYRLLDGDGVARRQYTGEYMSQYSWAEFTNSWLENELMAADR